MAFVGMTFITLFLAGKTAAVCFNFTPSRGAFLRSRFGRLSLVLLPLAYAAWVGITRIEDKLGKITAVERAGEAALLGFHASFVLLRDVDGAIGGV